MRIFHSLNLILMMGIGLASLAQGQEPERLQQHYVMIANRRVEAVFYRIVKTQQLEVVRCQKPEQWLSVDRQRHGWACFEKSTGIYVLNAVPPSTGFDASDIKSAPAPAGSGYDKEPNIEEPRKDRSRLDEPKYDFPSGQNSGCGDSPRCAVTPIISISLKQQEPPLLRAIKVGAGKTDEAMQTYRMYKREGVGAAIPCRTEIEKIIPTIITHTCGGIIR